jgi:hypothetical protein
LYSNPSTAFDVRARHLVEARWNRHHRDVVQQVAEARNDIEHAGFRSRPLPGGALRNGFRCYSPAIPLRFRCEFPCNSAARPGSGIRRKIGFISMTWRYFWTRPKAVLQGIFR